MLLDRILEHYFTLVTARKQVAIIQALEVTAAAKEFRFLFAPLAPFRTFPEPSLIRPLAILAPFTTSRVREPSLIRPLSPLAPLAPFSTFLQPSLIRPLPILFFFDEHTPRCAF